MAVEPSLKGGVAPTGGRVGKISFWQRGPEWQKLIDVKALHYGREADVPGVWR